eukprot:scaffold24090_cov196-Cylindrotheca_fusiformis.AAC.1
MRHCRHMSHVMAKQYCDDAMTIIEEIQSRPELRAEQPSWEWHHRLLGGNMGETYSRICHPSSSNARLGYSLHEVAAFFVQTMLGVNSTH